MSDPLVLVHAFPLSSAMWEPLRERLGAASVLAPDLPGFGGRPLPDGEPALAAYADDLVARLDAERIERAVLCGLSMGGYVLMELLRRAPERVGALVLADTKAATDPEPARQNRLRVAAVLEEEGTPRVLLDEQLPKLLGASTTADRPDVVRAVRRMVGSADPRAAAWAQRAMAARPDSFADLRGADVPVLVVVGDEDELSPPPDAEAMAQALPQGHLEVLPRVGHLSAVEDPDAFARVLTGWLRALPAPPAR